MAGLLPWLGQREALALLASLCWAGLCLHAWRRQRQRRTPAPSASDQSYLVAYASQSGMAENLARRSGEQLQSAGYQVHLLPLGEVCAERLRAHRRALFVVSTYGDGEPPDNARRFARRLIGRRLALAQLDYALIALGDSQYTQFCRFGRQLGSWLGAQGARALFDTLEVDSGDHDSLLRWQRQLDELTGSHGETLLETPIYHDWILRERHCLNPGSPGAPAYHIRLEPAESLPSWQAGDIAEVLLDSTAGQTRDYSIASLPANGGIELLVRLAYRDDGSHGLGSGWLCCQAQPGSTLPLRIRDNPGFQTPPGSAPLILIGSGTGIAGLRAHLLQRQLDGLHTNWLLFGERTREHDLFFHQELLAWQASGHLARLDLCFSRQDHECRYVQDLLQQCTDELRWWVQAGASIMVCGSLAGMGRGVDGVLREILGDTQIEQMLATKRYRRDLY